MVKKNFFMFQTSTDFTGRKLFDATSGVPLGEVHFFLLTVYINDIPDQTDSTLQMFADHLNIS